MRTLGIRIEGAAALTAVAVCAGVVAAVVPVWMGVALCAGGLLVLSLIAARRALGRISERSRSTLELTESPTSEPYEGEPPELRVARGLFYVGMLALGESLFRLQLGLTVSEIAFITAFGLCLLAALRGCEVTGLPSSMVIATGVFVFGAAISSLGAQSPEGSAFEVLHAVYVFLLWPWLGLMVIRTRRQLVTAVGLWAISAAVDGAAAIGQFVGLHGFGIAPASGRMDGFTTTPNDLGGVASVALVPALVLATGQARSRSTPVAKWLVVGLIAAALVLSGSITGMAGAVLALLLWLSLPAVRSSSRIPVVVAAVCALAAISVASGRLTSPIQRLKQVTSPAAQGLNGSAQDRLSNAEAAWKRIKQDPVIGRGLDSSDTSVVIISHGLPVAYQVHGLPVAAWYETGLFGLAGLLGLLGCLGSIGWTTVRRSATNADQVMAGGLLAAFAALLVEVMTQPMVLQQYDWVIAVMLVVWSRRAHVVTARATTDVRSGLGISRETLNVGIG